MEPAGPPPPDRLGRAPTLVEVWRRYDDDEQRLSAHVSERMLDLARLRPGSRVLDIATGRGEPALRAAARVGPDGVVVGTDLSESMLELARARAAALALTNLDLRVSDGETLAAVPEQGFDAALCRWGLMFFAHPRHALAAVRRRLRPGHPLVTAVWAEPSLVSWWSMPRVVLARQVELPASDVTGPGPFRYAEVETLRADLADAGFSVEHEQEVTTPVMESATPEGVIDWCLAFGLARLLAGHPPAIGEAWRRDMAVEAARYRDADGMYRLGGVTRLVVGRAP